MRSGIQYVTLLLSLSLFALSASGQAVQQVSPADTATAGRFDNGRMWTFDFPPVEQFAEAHGFSPDEAWFERARLGALRIPGCSASFVSDLGLVMTNHHCGRSHVSAVSGDAENLLDDGFYAETLDQERRVPGLYADQLVEIQDVTDEVYAALEGVETDAERADARRNAITNIQQRVLSERGGADSGYFVQVITLYNGARYSAYTFRRYDDVRLVMTPELAIGFFGGDPDNFSYPRYTLDMTFFRVYDNGQPYATPYYFPWSDNGPSENESVFIIGNPGSTNRLETVAQLEYRRDIQERYLLELINQRVAALEDYVTPDSPDAIRNELFSLLNVQKLYGGRVGGLQNEYLMGRRRDTERQFRDAVMADAALAETYGPLFDEMAQLQQERRELEDEYVAFLGLTPTSSLGSPIMRRALLAARYLTQQEQGAGADQLSQLRTQILNIPDHPAELQQAYVTDRIAAFRTRLASDHPELASQLEGSSDEEIARRLVTSSQLATSESTAAVLDDAALIDDPAIRLMMPVLDAYADFSSATAGIGEQETEIGSRLGRARFDIYGTEIPPDATFSLRIADGIVQGYPYNGTVAPWYTTFYGMYDRYYSFGPGTDWDLPARWHTIPDNFEPATPLNFVSTNDIIGGNSGSPVLNRDLEVVGLVFDGNIGFLPSSFIYVTDRARAVSVDSRGMIEALENVYGAQRIVDELRSGR